MSKTIYHQETLYADLRSRTVDNENGCWVWTGSMSGPQKDRPTTRFGKAYRTMWELTNGPIPTGMLVCHKCDNPPCINPDHLFLGTHKYNMQDCVKKGRLCPPPVYRGESNFKAKLTRDDVIEIRKRDSSFSRKQLADEFGVSTVMIRYIQRRQSWSWL